MKRPQSPLRIPEGRGPIFRIVVSSYLIVLSVGIAVLACDGIATGEIMAPHRYTVGHYIDRSAAPVLFWFCVVLYFSASVRILYSSVAEIRYARDLTNRSTSQPLTGEIQSARRSRVVDIVSEVGSKGYFARAQERAARRKSLWNLLDLPVGLACIGLVWWVFIQAMWAARNLFIPQHAIAFVDVFHSQRTGLAPIVFFVTPLFAAIPVGMLVSNCMLCCIRLIGEPLIEKRRVFGMRRFQMRKRTCHW